MREPTSIAKMYAWHKASIEGQRPETNLEEIHCGWFRCRMIKRGPWVPAMIWLHREIDLITRELMADEKYLALLNNARANPLYVWQRACGNPITRAAYDELIKLQTKRPEMAATHAAMDISKKAIRP